MSDPSEVTGQLLSPDGVTPVPFEQTDKGWENVGWFEMNPGSVLTFSNDPTLRSGQTLTIKYETTWRED